MNPLKGLLAAWDLTDHSDPRDVQFHPKTQLRPACHLAQGLPTLSLRYARKEHQAVLDLLGSLRSQRRAVSSSDPVKAILPSAVRAIEYIAIDMTQKERLAAWDLSDHSDPRVRSPIHDPVKAHLAICCQSY